MTAALRTKYGRAASWRSALHHPLRGPQRLAAVLRQRPGAATIGQREENTSRRNCASVTPTALKESCTSIVPPGATRAPHCSMSARAGAIAVRAVDVQDVDVAGEQAQRIE